jgi:hypothetical protein
VWPASLEDANAMLVALAHLDPQVRLAHLEPMENRELKANQVNLVPQEAEATRTKRKHSIAASAHKEDPDLQDPLDLLDQLDRMEILDKLELQADQLDPEVRDLKDLLETSDQLELLDPLDQLDSPDKAAEKDLLDRKDHPDLKEPLDPLDSPVNQPLEAAKEHLDLLDLPVNLELLENLALQAELAMRLHLETMPNIVLARLVADESSLKRVDELLPEVVVVFCFFSDYTFFLFNFSCVAFFFSKFK